MLYPHTKIKHTINTPCPAKGVPGAAPLPPPRIREAQLSWHANTVSGSTAAAAALLAAKPEPVK
jgi:hypothetical protein